MSWLNGLSAALTAGTQGAAGYLEGQQKGRKEEEERTRQMVAAIRQKRQDELSELLTRANINRLNKPEAPPEVSRGAAIFQDGKWVIPSPISPDPIPTFEERSKDGGLALYKDKVFDKWINTPKSKELTPAQVGAAEQRRSSNAMRMEQRYSSEPAVKRGADYASAYQGIVAAMKDDNPQTSLAMMYEAVKMRDPNAVREGELKLQMTARSIPDWLKATWRKAEKGIVLLPSERQQIANWAKEKVIEQQKLVRPIQSRFGAQLRGMGQAADSAFVSADPFAGIDLNERASKYRRP